MAKWKPPWYDSIEQYVLSSAWAGVIGTYADVQWRAQQESAAGLLISDEDIAEAKERLAAVEKDWKAAKKTFDTTGEELPPINWDMAPADSLGTGLARAQAAEGEVPEVEDVSDMEYLASLAADIEMEESSVKRAMKLMFPNSDNALAEFRELYGDNRPMAFLAIQETAKAFLGEPPPGDEPPPDWPGGYPGVGAAGAGGVGGGIGDLPGEFWNLLKSQQMPGGPGTAGPYYDAISQMMNPLQGEDTLDFLSRMTQPGQYYPSTFYSLINKAMMPMGMNMPEGFYGMMEAMYPSGFAPGYEADFSGLEVLGQAPMPEIGGFLLQMLESNPELGLALMEASIGMRQEYAMPFLPLLLGPAAQEGGGSGINDFIAAMLGGM